MSNQRIMHSPRRAPLSAIRSRLVIGLALAASAAACGAEAPDGPTVGSTIEEIIGGFPASSAKLNAIGAIGTPDGIGGFTPTCTGTLITPTIVLTAKHCLSAVDPTQLVFLIGPNAFAPIRIVPVRGAAVEPTLSGGVIGAGSDVGVLHLAESVTNVPLLPVAELTDKLIGTRLVALGYGVQNTDLTFGTRQSGSMTVRAVAGSVFAAIFGSFEGFVQNGAARFFPELDPNDPAQLAQLQQQFDETRLIDGIEVFAGGSPGDAQACTRDGGGPLTARVGTQTTVLAVSSWGFGDNATCTLDGSAFASMNPVSLDFISYETNCPLVPRAGTCESLTVALRCANVNEGGRRQLRTDCGELGQICGVDDSGALGCIDDPCEGLPAEGVCNGEVATRCSTPDEGQRRVITTDCAAQGQECTVDGGTAACVTPEPVCAHDRCVVGGALEATCDPCVAQICAADPFCCNNSWDGLCVNEVATVCGLSCNLVAPPAIEPRQ
jgi:hypothetical protein